MKKNMKTNIKIFSVIVAGALIILLFQYIHYANECNRISKLLDEYFKLNPAPEEVLDLNYPLAKRAKFFRKSSFDLFEDKKIAYAKKFEEYDIEKNPSHFYYYISNRAIARNITPQTELTSSQILGLWEYFSEDEKTVFSKKLKEQVFANFKISLDERRLRFDSDWQTVFFKLASKPEMRPWVKTFVEQNSPYDWELCWLYEEYGMFEEEVEKIVSSMSFERMLKIERRKFLYRTKIFNRILDEMYLSLNLEQLTALCGNGNYLDIDNYYLEGKIKRRWEKLKAEELEKRPKDKTYYQEKIGS